MTRPYRALGDIVALKVKTYGDAGERWPVRVGDIWTVGMHTLVCADHEQASGEAAALLVGTPDIAYVDPPWNSAMLTQFRAKAGLAPGIDFGSFMLRIIALSGVVSGDVYMEIGKQKLSWLQASLRDAGLTVHDVWPITYYKTKPAFLVRSSMGQAHAVSGSPEGMDDEDTPLWAIEQSSVPGDTVVDFCVGRGLTAMAAQKTGRRCIGIEMHPRRLAVAIDRLVGLGAGEPIRAGSLLW